MGTGTTAVTEALTTGFNSIASEISGILLIAIPIAFGVIGLVIAVKFGIRWFKGLVRGG